MSTPHALIVRLPSGTEYWYAEEIPEVGEVVSHFGNRYLVVSSEPSDDDRIVITLGDQSISADPATSSPLA